MLANEQFPEGFSKVVRAKFVSVTGISDNRVTLVAKKRNLNQADSALEVEISIAQGIIPIISDLKYTTNWIR
jgi:hypothetical protein